MQMSQVERTLVSFSEVLKTVLNITQKQGTNNFA